MVLLYMSRVGSRCLMMSQLAPYVCRCVQKYLDVSRWFQMSPDGSRLPRWSQTSPDGSRCLQMAPDGPDGPRHLQTAPYDPRWLQGLNRVPACGENVWPRKKIIIINEINKTIVVISPNQLLNQNAFISNGFLYFVVEKVDLAL